MILNYHDSQPIHIIGSGVVSQELQSWLQVDSINPVLIVDPSQFEHLPLNSHCVLGFWNIDYRQKLLEHDRVQHYRWPTYIHPRACVDNVTQLGSGTVIYPMCQLGHAVEIGSFGLIGPMCNIGHGSVLGSNVVVSPGTVIGGSSRVGDHVLFGQHSSIKNKINIAGNIKFTMNSVVTRDITESGNYYGNKRANVQF